MTKHFALLGTPISHSLSPHMQSAAFAAKKIDASYEAIDVNSIGLPELVARCRKEMNGFNVTAPHKESVIKLLDEVDGDATKVRAVNTVSCVDGRLVGRNTDIAGFVNALREAGIELKDQRILVMGTGGAARAVVHAAVQNGAGEVTVAGRRHARAIAICEALSQWNGTNLVAASMRDSLFQRACKTAHLLVHATSVLANSEEARTLFESFPMESTRNDAVAIDLSYAAKPTVFCARATACERRALDGRAMLVHQGALAFSVFTGEEAPIDAMRAAVDEALTPS